MGAEPRVGEYLWGKLQQGEGRHLPARQVTGAWGCRGAAPLPLSEMSNLTAACEVSARPRRGRVKW